MLCNMFVVISIIHVKAVLCEKKNYDFFDIYEQDDSYRGEKFPQKYLSVDGVQPTKADFSNYMNSLSRVVDYFTGILNASDANVAIGAYLMKGVLKRTLIDYSHKMKVEVKARMKDIIHKAEDIVSHFVYDNYKYGPEDTGFRLSRLFQNDESLIYSIGKFSKNVMKKWIYSNIRINEYIEDMDDISLPREKYVKIVMEMNKYYKIADSDLCISMISTHRMPLRKDEGLKPCRRDDHCINQVMKMPSSAYALSHRLFYLMALRHTRRCYTISEEADQMHLDIMCANMYRETVYLARRGYFYRDIFLEHIALCALLGYEEFFRYNWFQKSASWVDEDGCVEENRNFELNRTRIYIAEAKTRKEEKSLRKMRKLQLANDCQHHEMALTMNVLAQGIRHAAHYMNTTL